MNFPAIPKQGSISMNGFYARYGKRILDILISITGLVMLAPILSPIALSIRLTMGRPAIFRQLRPGLNRRGFYILKFRTMTEKKDKDGTYLRDNLRLTSFGRFLRMVSLDELPELWNVVRGDMSLIGPRPLLMKYLPYFKREEILRFDARPGITGLSQVTGRNELQWDKRCVLDTMYVNRVTVWDDLTILALTVWQVLLSRGIQVDPGTKMLNLDDERRALSINEKYPVA